MKKIIPFILLSFAFTAPVKAVKPAVTFAAKKNHLRDDAKEEARKRIEGYRQRVLKGENMSTLAAKYSEDPGSAKAGGVYQNVMPGMMVPEFEKVAFSLKPGEVSEVFETQFGFHFIQLISRTGDSVNLRHILVIPK